MVTSDDGLGKGRVPDLRESRVGDPSFRCAGRVRGSDCFGASVRILRFAISFADVQPIDRDLEIVGERAEQVALPGVRVAV